MPARLRAALAVACAVTLAAASCSGPPRDSGSSSMTTSEASFPAGWRQIQVDDDVTLAVPPDAVAQSAQPIDSIFGLLRGEGYEIAYDYGHGGDDLQVYAEEEGFTSRSREVGGRSATEIAFSGSGGPWAYVRLVRVDHGRNVLTLRMACADEETCRAADDLFDSVRLA